MQCTPASVPATALAITAADSEGVLGTLPALLTSTQLALSALRPCPPSRVSAVPSRGHSVRDSTSLLRLGWQLHLRHGELRRDRKPGVSAGKTQEYPDAIPRLYQ